MAIDIDKFVHDQLSVWPAVAAKYRALKSAQTRQMTIGGILVTLQSNPGRMPIFDHGCPLCEENYLEHQHFLPFPHNSGINRYRVTQAEHEHICHCFLNDPAGFLIDHLMPCARFHPALPGFRFTVQGPAAALPKVWNNCRQMHQKRFHQLRSTPL